MQKMYHRWLIVLIALYALSFAPVFAQQQCTTCGSTAQAMQVYFDMTTKVMSAIQTLGGQWPSVGRYTVPWLFQWGVVNIPEEENDLITRNSQAIARNISQKMEATAAVATILFTDARDIGRDSLMWITILAQNQAIVRDRSKLQNMGSVLQDKIYELSLGAARQSPITPWDAPQIQSILDQYRQSWLVSSYAIQPDTTYANILFVFQRMNRSFERFLAWNTISQFAWWYQAWSFEVYFDMDTIRQMKEDYACARFWDQCAGNLKQFVTDIKAVSSENVQAVKTAGKDVTDASKKLAQAVSAFWKQTANFFRKKEKQKAFTEKEAQWLSREQQLLRTVYGSDFKKMQNKQWVWLWDVKAGIVGLKQAVENHKQAKAAKKLETKDINKKTQESSKSQSNKENTTGVILTSISLPQTVSTILSQTMQDAYEDTKIAVQSANVVEPTEVMVYIPLLAYQLQTLRDLIGTKDTKGMLVSNLGTACELQCSNAGGSCW